MRERGEDTTKLHGRPSAGNEAVGARSGGETPGIYNENRYFCIFSPYFKFRSESRPPETACSSTGHGNSEGRHRFELRARGNRQTKPSVDFSVCRCRKPREGWLAPGTRKKRKNAQGCWPGLATGPCDLLYYRLDRRRARWMPLISNLVKK